MTHPSPHDKAADAVHEGRPVEAQYVRGGGKGRLRCVPSADVVDDGFHISVGWMGNRGWAHPYTYGYLRSSLEQVDHQSGYRITAKDRYDQRTPGRYRPNGP